MTTHAPFPTVRRAAAGLLAALLAGLATAAAAGDNVMFYVQPVDSTVVAGHPVAFLVEASLHPAAAAYQWYRNGVAVPGATARAYRFTAQPGDHGAQYHVIAQGPSLKVSGVALGPTPSSKATLTVLAAGSPLTPTITAPPGTSLAYATDNNGVPASTFVQFGATGNDLEWTYRFNSEPANTWHLLPAATLGAQAVRFNIAPPLEGTSLTARVVDDAGVAATRTWQLSVGTPGPGPVQFTSGPTDSTVVEGHVFAFRVTDNLDPSETPPPAYQWYRNGVAIGGATAARYSFTAQSADQGAQYYVVAAGAIKGGDPVGPTASPTATLTVLPAGSGLPPQIIEPAGDTFYYIASGGSTYNQGFRALGNDLRWAYRFDADAWTFLDAATNGAQYVSINVYPPAGKTSVTVRVVDDASVEATRTWAFVTNQAPTIGSQTVSATTVPWPGPVTLSVSATDPDGDALTYVWYVDYAGSVEGGDAVFTPSGASCTATFTKFGKYALSVAVLDGKGGGAQGAYATITVEATFDLRTDVNGDGVVNAVDLGLVLDNFGQVVP